MPPFPEYWGGAGAGGGEGRKREGRRSRGAIGTGGNDGAKEEGGDERGREIGKDKQAGCLCGERYTILGRGLVKNV